MINSFIMPEVIVGSVMVVTKDIPDNCIVVENPTKVINKILISLI